MQPTTQPRNTMNMSASEMKDKERHALLRQVHGMLARVAGPDTISTKQLCEIAQSSEDVASILRRICPGNVISQRTVSCWLTRNRDIDIDGRKIKRVRRGRHKSMNWQLIDRDGDSIANPGFEPLPSGFSWKSIRQIMSALEAEYCPKTHTYAPDCNDETIASKTGVTVAQVALIRGQAFGPLYGPKETLQAKAETIRQVLRSSINEEAIQGLLQGTSLSEETLSGMEAILLYLAGVNAAMSVREINRALRSRFGNIDLPLQRLVELKLIDVEERAHKGRGRPPTPLISISTEGMARLIIRQARAMLSIAFRLHETVDSQLDGLLQTIDDCAPTGS